MEIKIKIEDGVCDYTGQPGNVFVKLVNEAGETNWLGEAALTRAYGLIQSVSGGESFTASMPRPQFQPAVHRSQSQPEPQPAAQQPQPQPQPQPEPESQSQLLVDSITDEDDIPGVSKKGLDVDISYGQPQQVHVDPEVKKKDAMATQMLREELIGLSQQYSADKVEKGKNPGIPSLKLREIIKRYSSLFSSQQSFYNAFNGAVPMQREAFSVLLSNVNHLKGYRTTLEMQRDG